jgi:hypothetical protein
MYVITTQYVSPRVFLTSNYFLINSLAFIIFGLNNMPIEAIPSLYILTSYHQQYQHGGRSHICSVLTYCAMSPNNPRSSFSLLQILWLVLHPLDLT